MPFLSEARALVRVSVGVGSRGGGPTSEDPCQEGVGGGRLKAGRRGVGEGDS